jgi:branched-chain amino acid transport system substrate-binding protein
MFLFGTLGTPTNTAIRGYLNDNKVPQLFLHSGANKWNDPKHFPWTMGFIPSYGTEAHIYARYILNNLPDTRIAVLYQNDDSGKDYLNGMREGLGDKAAKMIVATQSYETTDPTVDSQIVALQGSGSDVLFTAAIPKVAAQAIRKVFDIGVLTQKNLVLDDVVATRLVRRVNTLACNRIVLKEWRRGTATTQ